MKLVKVFGGLGNQLFQLNFARWLSTKTGCEVRVDLSHYGHTMQHNGFEPGKVLRIPYAVASKGDYPISRELFSNKNLYPFAKRALSLGPVCRERGNEFLESETLSAKKNFYIGYWQNVAYFGDRNEYAVAPLEDAENLRLADAMAGSESVSVHVRHGDYAASSTLRIQEERYYRDAIAYLTERKEGLSFYFFSDDLDWVGRTFGDVPNRVIVDVNRGQNSYRDLLLMARCKHNVIANSSFSWWAAWLNANPDKTVIAPKEWYSKRGIDLGYEAYRMFPKSWVTL
ncbi:MAG TPA: alpha-1,2-fucosyltransferase [Treponemataceae bacterium]|nr:alpha-1,2-fucosyltransferase [Treponemataceae bacterium]